MKNLPSRQSKLLCVGSLLMYADLHLECEGWYSIFIHRKTLYIYLPNYGQCLIIPHEHPSVFVFLSVEVGSALLPPLLQSSK